MDLMIRLRSTKVADVGAFGICEALPMNLRTLKLDFGDTRLGDDGVRTMAQRLPHSLRSIFLDLRQTNVTDGGVLALKPPNLPQTLTAINLIFIGTRVTPMGVDVLRRAAYDLGIDDEYASIVC